ncbi:MAG: tetratricopeptide repeat protein [Pseudolabrys sp.]|nr:tetratricopeptide repeat protein [Pseudolabrys sp.]
MTSSRDRERMLAAAIAELRAGRPVDAERIARSLCEQAPNDARAFHLAGVLAHQLKRGDAAALLGRAVAIDPGFAEAHNDRGAILAADGALAEALSCFERAVAMKPGYAEARNNLARALRSVGRLDEAAAQFKHVLSAAPGSPLVHFELAIALEQTTDIVGAEEHYRKALALRADFLDAQLRLAGLLQRSGRWPEALTAVERAAAIAPGNAGVRNNLGNVLRAMERHPEAVTQYEAALRIDPNSFAAHYNLGMALRGETRIAEAREHFGRALALKPDFLEAELAQCIAELPAIYASTAEIDERRAAYAGRLAAFSAKVERTDIPAAFVDAIGAHQPFYLPYQGRDDRELQSQFGAAVCKVMASRYQPLDRPAPPLAGEPIRLGIVSGFFRQHSNWKIPIKGWLKMLDRSRFRVFGYHTGVERDGETEAAAALCERFIAGPRPLDAWRAAIAEDAPHVLLFPEIGMDKVSAQLAAMRLAPVQCTSWGHPVTSGFPTIDYFLSSDLMEPQVADALYSERLVRLPNLSIYYEAVGPATVHIDRAELGLREDSVVYWCAQSLPKYLPDFDDVFARIAAEVPNSQFAFIEFSGGRGITELFKARLAQTFIAVGLKARDHCVFLPRMAPDRFVAAIGQCDVVLDSIGWSGCNSILESLAHDLPVVAFEGEWMRGRHAAAILRMMQVEGTTARTTAEYVSMASALGRDKGLRHEISQRMAASKHRLYRDGECIAGLEAFLDAAVRKS